MRGDQTNITTTNQLYQKKNKMSMFQEVNVTKRAIFHQFQNISYIVKNVK